MTYYQGISDSFKILGHNNQVMNVQNAETHSVNSASPHVGRVQSL